MNNIYLQYFKRLQEETTGREETDKTHTKELVFIFYVGLSFTPLQLPESYFLLTELLIDQICFFSLYNLLVNSKSLQED